jgi:hypothetical protein
VKRMERSEGEERGKREKKAIRYGLCDRLD